MSHGRSNHGCGNPVGEVTSGVPTLAELLQSDGETDLLENQAYRADGRSNVTDAVPSLGALLEEEDTDMSLEGAHNAEQQQPERTTPGATQLPLPQRLVEEGVGKVGIVAPRAWMSMAERANEHACKPRGFHRPVYKFKAPFTYRSQAQSK